jgi:hypothetical protein
MSNATSLRDRLPQFSDGELTNLNNNATRLKETGSALQRRSAEELLPLIQSEIERRRAEKAAAAPAKARAKKAAAAADAAAPAKKPRKVTADADE